MLTNLAKYLELYTNAEKTNLYDKQEVSMWANDGVGNDMFSTKSNLTREQTYIIMHRMLNDIIIVQ